MHPGVLRSEPAWPLCCGVLIHNLRPGLADSLGVGATAMRALNPRLVYCGVGAFGHAGPLAGKPGYEPLAHAFSGIMAMNGPVEGPAMRAGVSIVDPGTAMYAAIGIMAALRRRETTGEGGRVDVSLFETGLGWVYQPLADYLLTGREPERQGNGNALLTPYQVFDTADEPLMIAAGNDRLYRNLCAVLARARVRAAELLGTEDVAYKDGRFVSPGSNRSFDLFDLGPLEAQADIETPLPAYPNGCHVAEVAIDPDTGVVTLLRYTAVDDVGLVINPLLVEGQVHGGIAQGVGQALHELCAYAPDGQLIAGSFMDYAVPRAGDLPFFGVAHNTFATGSNLLGAKGGGEGGTTPAPAAVVNAIIDALGPDGPDHLDMPVTSEVVWRALRRIG